MGHNNVKYLGPYMGKLPISGVTGPTKNCIIIDRNLTCNCLGQALIKQTTKNGCVQLKLNHFLARNTGQYFWISHVYTHLELLRHNVE